MENPYLNRDESIILTTHRVSVDSVSNNVMLTNERLIFIDDRYASFQPRSIMLHDIATLRSGKISSGEPVITLNFTSPEKENQPLYLIFSQQYGETRKQERDEWVKKIMELRIALIQKSTPLEISSINHKKGLQPSVRHWIAPEKIRPFTTIGNQQPEPVPLTFIPDEPDSSVNTPLEEVFTSPAESPSSEAMDQSAFQILKPELPEETPADQPASEKIFGTAEEPVSLGDESASPLLPVTPVESLSNGVEWPVLERDEPEQPEETPADQPASEEIFGTAEEPVSLGDESASPLLPVTPVESLSNGVEWPVLERDEPEQPEETPADQPASEEIFGTAEEPVSPGDESESPLLPVTPVESFSNGVEWPVLERIETEQPEETPADQPASEEIFGTAEEPVSPGDESEPPLLPVTPVESFSNGVEWPVLERIETEQPEETPADQPASEEIFGTADEPALLSLLPAENNPSSTKHLPMITLESLTSPRESVNLSGDPCIRVAIGENPVEGIETSTVVSPEEQQFPAPLSEGLEKPEGDSPLKIVIQSPDSEEPFPQRGLITPEPAVPYPEEEIVTKTISPPGFSLSNLIIGGSGKKTALMAGCIIFLILLLAGGTMIISSLSHKDNALHSIPVVNTTPNVTLKMTPLPFLIPQSGLWVRINSSVNYIGHAGNPNLLKPVSGSGNQMYQVLNSNGIVQVSVQKQDNSGSSLSVEIYKDGNLLASRKVTAPMGSIDLLIDSKTGYPPGLTANGTIPQDIRSGI